MSFIASFEILTNIQKYLSELGIDNHPINYHIDPDSKKFGKYNVYSMDYYGDSMKVLNIIYENSENHTRLSRKYDIYKSMIKHSIKPKF